MHEQKINPKMMMLAREARGLTQIELAEKAGINRSGISRFEQEFMSFSEETFEQIVKVLGFPKEFFFQKGEIAPPVFYRKRDKVPAKFLTYIDATVNLYRLNFSRLLEATKIQSPDFPSLPLSEKGTPGEVASALRKIWEMSSGPVSNLIELMEANGIISHAVDFKTDRVDSRSFFIDSKYPVIFYNKNLLGDRLRFTLAFELGHLLMHSRVELTSTENLDHEANLFAAEFLMPAKDILPDLKENINIDALARLKKKWKVSMQSILYRADDLGLVSENQKRYIIGQFNALKIRRREPVELDIPIEKSHLLKRMIIKYRFRQKMSVKEMADFFHLHPEEFLEKYD
jgi:Zn-dependent peptidase ImmA (M78 family)/DNA-binding XRE family transcriptional regulator